MSCKGNNNKFHKLTSAQSVLLWAMAFSFEKKKVIEGDLVVFGLFAEKDFDPDAMEKAFNKLLKHNDALRMQVYLKPYGFRQRINAYQYDNLNRISCRDKEEFTKLIPTMGKNTPLLAEKLYNVAIANCTNGTGGGLLMMFHHFCCDGYSENLICKQLEEYYNCYKDGKEPVVKKDYSYLKFLEADKKYHKSKAIKADRKYWFRKYNSQKNYSFPSGRIPWKCSISGESIQLEGEAYETLMSLCLEHRCSYSSAIMSVIAMAVGYISKDINFCLYSLFHGRMTAALKNTIGNMINSYPVFFHIDPEMTLGSFIENSYSDYLEALSHGRYPAQTQVPMAAKETYIKRFGYNHMWFLFSSLEFDGVNNENSFEIIDAPETYLMGHFHFNVLNYTNKKKLYVTLTYQNKKLSSDDIIRYLKIFKEIMCLSLFDGQLKIKEMFDKLDETDLSKNI